MTQDNPLSAWKTGVMTDSASTQLGEFLKARRSELEPHAVGLPEHNGPRRVKGLRREEVAFLVSISPDYYTRLEQGRRQASAPVLEALARVLQLDDNERSYLFELAGKAAAAPPRRTAQKVYPQLERILAEVTSPAFVLGRRMDILAWNQLSAALITDFDALPEKSRNYAHLLFTDRQMRDLHLDWETMAQACVAMLRMEAGRNPHDKKMAAMVGELSIQDHDFRRWWADHRVASRTGGTKRLRHPVVGELTLEWDALTCDGEPEQQLVIWTAEPGSSSYDSLRLLNSWQASLPQVTGRSRQ